jgi:hypothetical protein
MVTPAPVHLLPGTSFQLGDVACATDPRIHPEFPTIYEKHAAWVAKYIPVPSEQAMRGLLEACYAAWDAMIYHGGLAERVFHTSRVTALMFEVDDISLLRPEMFDQVAADWTSSGHPFGPAFADVFGTFEREMAPRVYERYRAAWRAWYGPLMQELWFRKSLRIPDLETYLPLRRYTIGVYPYIVAAEYVLDHDLTDLLAADPDFARAGDAVVDHIMLVNDLFSVRNEAHGGEPFNAVLITLHHNGGRLQHAIDLVRDLIADAYDTLTEVSRTLRSRYPEPAVHSYLDTLDAMCAGNLCWYRSSSRYHGSANPWNGIRTGTVTLHHDRTAMAPASRR